MRKEELDWKKVGLLSTKPLLSCERVEDIKTTALLTQLQL